MLYIEPMLRKELIFNTKFKYADNIVILRINLIISYTAATLVTDVKNVFNWGKDNALFFDLIKCKLKYFYKSKTFKIKAVITLSGTFKVEASKKVIR